MPRRRSSSTKRKISVPASRSSSTTQRFAGPEARAQRVQRAVQTGHRAGRRAGQVAESVDGLVREVAAHEPVRREAGVDLAHPELAGGVDEEVRAQRTRPVGQAVDPFEQRDEGGREGDDLAQPRVVQVALDDTRDAPGDRPVQAAQLGHVVVRQRQRVRRRAIGVPAHPLVERAQRLVQLGGITPILGCGRPGERGSPTPRRRSAHGDGGGRGGVGSAETSRDRGHRARLVIEVAGDGVDDIASARHLAEAAGVVRQRVDGVSEVVELGAAAVHGDPLQASADAARWSIPHAPASRRTTARGTRLRRACRSRGRRW